MYIQHHEGLVLSSDSRVRYVDVLQCRVGGAYVFQQIGINLLPGLYIQAQQLDGDLPHDGAEEVGVPADVQKNIFQVIYIICYSVLGINIHTGNAWLHQYSPR